MSLMGHRLDMSEFYTHLKNDIKLWSKTIPHYVNHPININTTCVIAFFRGEINPLASLFLKIRNDSISNIIFYPTNYTTDKIDVIIADNILEHHDIYDKVIQYIYVETVQELYDYVEKYVNTIPHKNAVPNGYFKNLPILTSLQKILDKKKPMNDIIIEI